MRWRLFAVYLGITAVLMVICISDYIFGSGTTKKLGLRLFLCIIWPVAGLSRAGRNMLLKSGEKL